MQKLYADIIVDITQEKLDRTFQYIIPDRLREKLEVGMLVQVPFGKGSRTIKGYVIKLTDTAEFDLSRLKEIQEIVTDGLGPQSRLVRLAAWIREQYGSAMIQALKTVIPVKKKIKAREKKSIRLIMDREKAVSQLEFYRKKHQAARARLLEALLEDAELPYELAAGRLNITSAVIKALEEQQVIVCSSEKVYRNPLKGEMAEGQQISLNAEQQAAAEGIIRAWEAGDDRPSLIHGVTGSGKTEVYMELIAHVVENGQQAIMLIPEIALTYQTVMRFYRRFGGRISVVNSRLSDGEKYDQFERARNGDIDVMIGPRSALFTPFQNLGAVIIDEEHERTYKSETTPRYDARETAIRRAEMEGARVVLGSATPSVESYYRALEGQYSLYQLKKRVREGELPDVCIADMREELKAGNRSIFSRRLLELTEDRLKNGEQVMLFLNRRGYSGFLSCRSCGHVMKCPHCEVSLSAHNNGKLVCHYCGYEEEIPHKCPSCGSAFLRGFKAGTQQIEELVRKQFPSARVLRMDLDTTKGKGGHDKILESFLNREADILIGTQMIVKGHDFPNVTLVGVLAADLSLHAGDYRCAERTFQLLTQAAGRAGRGERPGEVVIQTYDPSNYAVQAAASQDYEGFYWQEILFRSLAGYPPVSGMMAIHGTSEDQGQLELAMEYLKKLLDQIGKKNQLSIVGPADETVSKISDVYRKVLYVKHERREMLIMVKDRVEQYIEMNQGYKTINIQFELE